MASGLRLMTQNCCSSWSGIVCSSPLMKEGATHGSSLSRIICYCQGQKEIAFSFTVCILDITAEDYIKALPCRYRRNTLKISWDIYKMPQQEARVHGIIQGNDDFAIEHDLNVHAVVNIFLYQKFLYMN